MTDIIGTAAGSIAPTGVGSTLTVLFSWGFVGLLLGAIGYLAWYWFSNKIRVNIYTMTASGVKKTTTRMREVRDKHNKSIILHKLLRYSSDWEGEIPTDYFITVKKSFGSFEEVNFARDTKGRLQLIKPVQAVDMVKFKGVDGANQKWAAIKTKEMQARYSRASWWDKHSATVMGAATILIVMVVLVVIIRELSAMQDATTSGLRAVADSIRLLVESSDSQFIVGDAE